jgi:hypothetical protein
LWLSSLPENRKEIWFGAAVLTTAMRGRTLTRWQFLAVVSVSARLSCDAFWYEKARLTFADALAQVRRALWRQLGFLALQGGDKQTKTCPSFIPSASQNCSLTSPENGGTRA